MCRSAEPLTVARERVDGPRCIGVGSVRELSRPALVLCPSGVGDEMGSLGSEFVDVSKIYIRV